MGIGAIVSDVAGVTLNCVKGGGECPGAAASLFPAVWEFHVAIEAKYSGSARPLTPGFPSNAGAEPSGGVTPDATGSLSRAGPLPPP